MQFVRQSSGGFCGSSEDDPLWFLWDFLLCCSFFFCFTYLAVCVCFFSWVSVHAEKEVSPVCAYKHQSPGVCLCVCVVGVHASLWDALISTRCGSAPSCPCGRPLIETNQAYDGPITVTPHPSHPRPNHLLIGPRRAPSHWNGRLIWPADEGSRRE